MPVLYDAVALGMGAYTRSAFRVRTIGGEGFRLLPGTLIVVTHRRETDVPVLCPSIYRHGRMWGDRHRVAFAAREDMHDPGFFAGFPKNEPRWLRRATFPISIGSILRRRLLVYPIRSASAVRLNDVFRQAPDLSLEMIPGDAAEAFRRRAAAVGLPSPVRGADVVRGEYADLLWRTLTRAELNGASLEAVWSQRAALAIADFRTLVDLVRKGAVLVIFPEGRPSPDGQIGPLLPGLDALVRRAKPRWIQPVGIAYDPLVRGRTRVLVAFPPAAEAPAEGGAAAVLGLLRHAVPLTAGQVVADALTRGEQGAKHIEANLAAAVVAAAAEGRAVEPELERPEARRKRVLEALAAARSQPGQVAYLAREFSSAREGSCPGGPGRDYRGRGWGGGSERS